MHRWLVLVLAVLTDWARAQTPDLQAVQARFQTTFTNQSVVDFRPGPIQGLYEVNLGEKIIYYHPEQALLFFGEIYHKAGYSLTADSLAKSLQRRLAQLPMQEALIIGPEQGREVIEFTDPDCPYCRAYHNYMAHQSRTQSIRRVIFFDTRAHPGARRKVAHILCAKNSEQALSDVYQGRTENWNVCPEGLAQADRQQKASIAAGVNGTPAFIIGGALVTGFKKDEIEQYLNPHNLKGDATYAVETQTPSLATENPLQP